MKWIILSVCIFLFRSVTQSCLTLCNPMDCTTPGFPVHHQIPEFTQTHIHHVSDAIQPSHPLMSPSPPIFPSIRVFSNESVLHIRLSNYWSFSFSICPSNEYSGLISFRINWFDLLAVQKTLKSLLQHYSSKTSILQCSIFFIVQLSHPYMTTGKTITLTGWAFVGKVMCVLSNMLSSFVIAFLPMSKYLLVSWLQWPCAVILELKNSLLLFPFPALFTTKWQEANQNFRDSTFYSMRHKFKLFFVNINNIYFIYRNPATGIQQQVGESTLLTSGQGVWGIQKNSSLLASKLMEPSWASLVLILSHQNLLIPSSLWWEVK